MGATMLLGLASCSDDHFDIKNGTASANNTIWQNLQANPDKFSDVSSILQKVRVYKSLEDKKRTLTYAELLNQPQTLTFWAPVNGSFDPQPYLSRIDQINSYREQGLTDKADTLEYNLGMQFAQNHLARFNFESIKEDQDVRLYNSKLATYNAGQRLFNGVEQLDTEIPSSNGVLHALKGVSPFAFNIYDYIGEHQNEFQTIYNALTDPAINKRIFSESSSTPGGMNSEGQMVYIDSVYSYSNEYVIIDDCNYCNRHDSVKSKLLCFMQCSCFSDFLLFCTYRCLLFFAIAYTLNIVRMAIRTQRIFIVVHALITIHLLFFHVAQAIYNNIGR